MTDSTSRPEDRRGETKAGEPTGDRRDDRSPSEPGNQAVKAATPPVGAAAGAIAGATAGLATGVFGPMGAMIGAIVGALGGTAAGTAAATQADDATLYTQHDDDEYRRIWEAMPNRQADRGFETARVAYQFGHIAARQPELAGARFSDVEPQLRQKWPNELRERVGEWDAVRPLVEDAYSKARSSGVGERRDTSVVGSAGSAVDPVELDRARAGLPSVPEPEQRG